ncbi:hypothetical protein FQN57_003004 [Myotisia sp. PD_48]|nr:hypothetical protein FQN57_003004 [Myotisia sp. PD_48]
MSNPDEKSAKRYPNVYDAVAGRVSRKKFYANHSSTSASHQTKSSYAITPALTPDELLFRRSTAPIRYMENDHYFANKEIPLDQSLPDSDLLKAIHLYTSELYEYNTDDKGLSAWRSMDETALIALGFLLEELSTDALEETGDMVFVEGEEVTDFGEMSDSDGGMSTGLSSRRRQNMGEYQPPKAGLSAAAKQDLILAHLRSTRTCHTLKDLEKMLPAAVPVNGMQVKEHIQALTDDGKVHVEKIGSGNWYWAWGGEEKKSRERIRSDLTKDLEKVERSMAELVEKIKQVEEKQRLEDAKNQTGTREENEKQRLEILARRTDLEQQVAQAESEINRIIQAAGEDSIEQKEKDIAKWKEETQIWTDNIYILEEYVKKLAGGDREVLDAVQRQCYGSEYIEGEGLRELEL